MKNLLCLTLLFALGTQLFAQNELKPSKTKSLIKLTILNPDQSPYANSNAVFKDTRGNNYQAKTDSKGQLNMLLPMSGSYSMHCGNLSNDRIIKTSNRAYEALGTTRYTHRFIDYTFEFKSEEDDSPVVGEEIKIISESGKEYKKPTEQNGRARFFLPLGEDYTVHLKHYPDLAEIIVTDKGQSRTATGYTHWGLSAFELEEQERIWAEEEARWQEEQRIADSIRATQPTQIIFFASNRNHKRVGAITVYDGGKEGTKIGEINSVWSCTVGPSKERAEVVTPKMKGTYKYYAISTEGVEWEGTYEVFGGGTGRVILPIK